MKPRRYLQVPFLLAPVIGSFPCPAAAGADANRWQGRSLVISTRGIVATEHPLASQAGAMILAGGGHAVDAAIAANAAMGFLSPGMCGVGGDLFAIVYDAKSGKLHGLNASGWAPQALSIERIKAAGFTAMPQEGVHTVTVPGAVEGWQKLHERFGRTKLSQVLEPAIRYASHGVPVSEWVADYWLATEAGLRQTSNAARTFLPAGRAPRAGEVFRNPDLARTYEQIGLRGRRAFYEDEIARRIVAYSEQLGGTMTRQDLKDFAAEWVEPISTGYRGWTVYELPPNGQGVAALAMLNLMEQFPLGEFGPNSARALHVVIEAKKLAYADMIRHVADPAQAKVPVSAMLAKDYARKRAGLIDPARASDRRDSGIAGSSETTYLAVVDAEGNMVSLIQSNYLSFGSRLVPDGCGFPLHNRGGLFSLDPSHPNALRGRKRPLHTIIPAFMSKGDVRIAFGIMGGFNQAQAHAQFVSNLVDHHLNLQQALEAPRVTKLTFEGRDVQMEQRIPEVVRAELTAKGHAIGVLPPFSGTVGSGQAVMRDFAAGVNTGASDPRRDGAAVPEPFVK